MDRLKPYPLSATEAVLGRPIPSRRQLGGLFAALLAACAIPDSRGFGSLPKDPGNGPDVAPPGPCFGLTPGLEGFGDCDSLEKYLRETQVPEGSRSLYSALRMIDLFDRWRVVYSIEPTGSSPVEGIPTHLIDNETPLSTRPYPLVDRDLSPNPRDRAVFPGQTIVYGLRVVTSSTPDDKRIRWAARPYRSGSEQGWWFNAISMEPLDPMRGFSERKDFLRERPINLNPV